MELKFQRALHPLALLCARHKWPRDGTAEERDELAPLHAEYGDFLPCRLTSSPPGLTLGLPHA